MIIKLSNGTEAEFPDGTTAPEINAVLSRDYPDLPDEWQTYQAPSKAELQDEVARRLTPEEMRPRIGLLGRSVPSRDVLASNARLETNPPLASISAPLNTSSRLRRNLARLPKFTTALQASTNPIRFFSRIAGPVADAVAPELSEWYTRKPRGFGGLSPQDIVNGGALAVNLGLMGLGGPRINAPQPAGATTLMDDLVAVVQSVKPPGELAAPLPPSSAALPQKAAEYASRINARSTVMPSRLRSVSVPQPETEFLTVKPEWSTMPEDQMNAVIESMRAEGAGADQISSQLDKLASSYRLLTK